MDLSVVDYVQTLHKSIVKFRLLCRPNEIMSTMEKCQVSKPFPSRPPRGATLFLTLL